VLILGGTGEARALAARLAGDRRFTVTSSLAGRVSDPALPLGDVRIGGFGGVDGLATYLRAEGIDAVVDATHPFAATISSHAAHAATQTARPIVMLRRPGWCESGGDAWRRVPDIATAARAAAASPPGCVFVTTGRRDLGAYAGDDQHDFLVRTVDPPEGDSPPRMTLLLDRGPFTVEGETALMARYDVRMLVTKDSGGEMTSAKLAAARERGIPVVMVERPPVTAGVDVVETVDQVMAWLAAPDTAAG
jgi:precorrin-6A/cobalt-precorrin-6A reductase